jgi:predicted RNase H-like HicB family nuclease
VQSRVENVFIVKINFDVREGYIYAMSPDLPGLHVCGESEEKVRASALLAVKTLFKRNRHLDVDVRPVAPDLESFTDARVRFDRVAVQIPC